MFKRFQKIGISLIAIELVIQLGMPILDNLPVFKTIESKAVVGVTDNRFEYTVNSDNSSITLTKYIGTDTEVVIPSIIDGYSVTIIGREAFRGCTILTEIQIPDSVMIVGDWAFYYCNSLTSIEIPNSITNIGKYAFADCSSLTSIKILGNITYIGERLFQGCRNLTNIEIPNSVTNIESSAFSGCSSLTSIEIPNSITNIGEYAFVGCSSLTSIKIPNSLTSIGNGLFSSCSSLINIDIPNGVTTIGNWAFSGCANLTNINIPNSVTSIGDNTFYNCGSLPSIIIPDSVTHIGKWAFANCKGLTNITIPNNVTVINECTFYGCTNLISVILPNSVTSIGDRAFDFCDKLTNITIPNSVTNIGESAFSGCDSLLDIVIPNGITDISNEMFYKCWKLQNVTIADSITNIGDRVFYECVALTSIEIPNKVTSIGDGAFNNCSSLQSIIIPNETIQIGEKVFEKSNSVIVKCKSNSTAHTYAVENSINYELDDVVTLNNVTYSKTIPTKDNVTVTITANEELRKIEGWNLSEDRKVLTKTYSTNTQENIEILDLVGNVTTETIKITNIDRTAPILNVNYENQEDDKVKVVITANEEVQEVSGWTISTDKKILTKIYNAIVTEDVIIKDLAGNETTAYIGKDEIAPILTVAYSTTNATNGNVVVTITANEEVQAVEGWTISIDKKVLTKTYSANATENVTVKDLVGNESVAQVKINNIDKTVPTLAVAYNTKNATNENVVVTITANEEVQELSGWTISIDKKVLTKTYSANATENVTVKDLAGNESVAQVKINNIDKTVPTLAVAYSTTNATNENVVVTITANEEVQELSGWTISTDKKVLTKTYSANATENITVKDLVGNESVAQVKISNIDKTAPILNISYTTPTITNQTVTVTITANEEVQELEGWALSENKKVLTKTYNMNVPEDIMVFDLAGNATLAQIRVTGIDKIAPKLFIGYEKLEKGNVEVKITADEEIQEVEGWTISEDKKVLTKTYSENVTENITIKDLVGNEAVAEVKISNIDKIAPVLNISYTKATIANQTITVTITANEEVQKVSGWTISEDKKVLTKTYNMNLAEDIMVFDLAGNNIIAQIRVTGIDKIAPKLFIGYGKLENGNVEVKITADEEIQEVEGWTISEDKKELTKVYTENIEESIKVKDLVGNETVARIKVTDVEKLPEALEIATTKYTVDEENKYIKNIKAGTTKENIISNLKANVEYRIVTQEGKEVTNEKIGTGMKVIFETGEQYEIVVLGDLNGDGRITVSDISKIKKHIIGQELLEGCYKEASDIDSNKKISITDLSNIKKAIIGLKQL